MMTAVVVEPASITLWLASNKLTEAQLSSNDKIGFALRTSLTALMPAIKEHGNET